jgi:hypothetical protein
MAGPWEDYKEKEKEKGPWSDYQAKEEKKPKEEKDRTILSASGEAAFNFLPSLYGLVEPIIERPGETAKAVGGLLTEVALSPTVSPTIRGAIEGEKERLSERYGSGQQTLRTLAEDPAGLLADVSLLATGAGGALRAPAVSARAAQATTPSRWNIPSKIEAPGVVSRTAERAGDVLSAFGQYTDPFSATASALRAVGPVTSGTFGVTTGAGPRAVQEAFAAGKKGGTAAEAFTSQMRGTAALDEVLPPVKRALENIRIQRSDAYRSGMVDIKADKTILDFDRIDKTLADIKDRGFYKGKEIQRSAANTWGEIDSLISNWKQSDPAQFHTPEGLDALKKAIGDIRDNLPFGTPARNVANNAYNAVREQITRQAPTYSKVMKEYEEASTLIQEIESALSLGKKANAEQSLRKLQSIMRDNVMTSYGRRGELGDELVKAGAENLYPQLAGQSMSSMIPRGIVAQGTMVTSGVPALTSGNLATLPIAAATSPRIVGEAALATGRVAGVPAQLARQISRFGDKLAARSPDMAMAVDMARRSVQLGTQIDPLMARMLAYQFSRLEQEENKR